jgi:hypothetical protein
VPTLGPEPRIRAMGVVDMALWVGRMSGWFPSRGVVSG